jgi:hypothetical protein
LPTTLTVASVSSAVFAASGLVFALRDSGGGALPSATGSSAAMALKVASATQRSESGREAFRTGHSSIS